LKQKSAGEISERMTAVIREHDLKLGQLEKFDFETKKERRAPVALSSYSSDDFELSDD
jgi:hypothetical protein